MAAGRLLAYSISQYVAALSVVSLRCWARSRSGQWFGNDDWVMIGALTAATACFISYMLQIRLGLGNRIELLEANAASYRELLMFRFCHQVSVVIALGLVKMSICLFLLRLVRKRLYIWALWAVIGIMSAFTFACVGTIVFQCIPVAAAWDYTLRAPPIGVGNAKCFSLKTFTEIGLGNGVVHIVTDILLALMPIPLIRSLQVTTRIRISLIVVLSLGAFAAIAGIMRQINVGPLDEHDAYSIWNFLELHMGMIAASLPSLKKPFAEISGKVSAKVLSKIPSATGLAKTGKPRASSSILLPHYEACTECWHQKQGSSEYSILEPQNGILKTTNVEISSGWQ